MRVAIVVEKLNTTGGAERRTFELVKCLLSLGHEVDVYASDWGQDVSSCGAGFHRLPILKLSRSTKPLSFAFFSSLLIPRKKYDLVHTQARIFRYDVATLGFGCHRAYLEALGIDYKRAPDHLFQRTTLQIEKKMLRRGHFRKLIANSEMCKAEISRFYGVPSEDIIVVNNGVDIERFSSDRAKQNRTNARRSLGLREDDTVILYVGAGFYRKGLDTLVASAGNLKHRNCAKILVVGRGGRDEYEKLAADSGIAGRLVWGGHTTDIIQYYSAADIFALPSRYDPFANSTMEALSCGIPVVTTSRNGVSEILRDGIDSYVIPPNAPDQLTERLDILMRDHDLASAMGVRGREAVKLRTWRRTAEETIAVYENVV